MINLHGARAIHSAPDLSLPLSFFLISYRLSQPMRHYANPATPFVPALAPWLELGLRAIYSLRLCLWFLHGRRTCSSRLPHHPSRLSHHRRNLRRQLGARGIDVRGRQVGQELNSTSWPQAFHETSIISKLVFQDHGVTCLQVLLNFV